MRYKDMNYFRYGNNIIAKILSAWEEMHKTGRGGLAVINNSAGGHVNIKLKVGRVLKILS